MDVGTIEAINDIEQPKKRRSRRFGGSNPGSGGGDKLDGTNDDEIEQFVPNKSRILTAFILLVVLMTFGGLIAAYIVLATNNTAEWKPFDLPIQVWISTFLILVSSATYHLGKTSIDRNDQRSTRIWLLATTVLGAAFISSQIMAWIVLTSRGLYMSGNPFAGFFYILTAVHAVHVLGGIAALGSIVLRSWRPTGNADEIANRKTLGQVVGWYWHFMGALWLVLFILLGFWK